MAERYKHFRFEVLKDKGAGDSAQVPANGVTIDVYRQGAYIETGIVGLGVGASGDITVRDFPRDLIMADDLFRLDASPVDTTRKIRVNTITVATRVLNIRNDTGAILTIAAGERWTPLLTKPSLWNESTGTNAVSLPFQTDNRGAADCYIQDPVVDYVESGGGVTARGVPDHAGEIDNVWYLIVRDVASVIAGTIRTLTASTQGTLLQILNGATQKWRVDFDGATVQQGKLTVAASGADITGNQTITGTLSVTGAATLSSTLAVTGLSTLSGGTSLPAGDIVTADIADVNVTTAKLANNAATQGLTAVGTTNFSNGGTVFVLLGGLTHNFTPNASASGLLFVVDIPRGANGGTAQTINLRIQDTTAPTTVAEVTVTYAASEVKDTHIHTFLATAPTVATTYEVQVKPAGLSWAQDSSGTMNKRRFSIVELKK